MQSGAVVHGQRMPGNCHLPHSARVFYGKRGNPSEGCQRERRVPLGPTPEGIPRCPSVHKTEKGKRPGGIGGPSAKSDQNHANGRGHSVVVVDGGHVPSTEPRKAWYMGEGPEFGGALAATYIGCQHGGMYLWMPITCKRS